MFEKVGFVVDVKKSTDYVDVMLLSEKKATQKAESYSEIQSMNQVVALGVPVDTEQWEKENRNYERITGPVIRIRVANPEDYRVGSIAPTC